MQLLDVANASRDELMQHFMADAYTRTVARRIFEIEGVLPTQAFLRELVALELCADDEPHVARLVASLNTVVDAHHEIIGALRRARATSAGKRK